MCKTVETKKLLPGWMCCKCKKHNNHTRTICKGCEHSRCEDEIPGVKSENGKVKPPHKDGLYEIH